MKMSDQEAVKKLGEARQRVLDEVHKAIVGMDEVIEALMISIFARGHCLMEGVPGLAKTFLVSTLSQALSLDFKRVQFTPDLMPADIIGSEILQDDPETGQRQFKFMRGPIFTQILLADEINRTPPKTQAALLEAMQEKQISVAGQKYRLGPPFFVLATQNPLEQEGTYPLPEAQLDRFLFKVFVDYPTYDEEIEVMRRITGTYKAELQHVLASEEIIEMQELVKRVPVAEHIFQYVARLVRATRYKEAEAPDFIKQYVSYGAGPRACLNFIIAGKARAVLHGRFHVSVDDIKEVALPILRHRIAANFAAQSEGMSTDDIIRKLIEVIPSDESLYDGKKTAKGKPGAKVS
ncbi:MAG: MoxR family ATPase [Planctomycetes bacterium]|nr:MoxR family ATPase [Planctomycetota bacterium]